MALGITDYQANKILDHLRGGTAWSQPSGLYAKLHTGSPGAAVVPNAAGSTTASDLDTPGVWSVQGTYTNGGTSLPSAVGQFKVTENL